MAQYTCIADPHNHITVFSTFNQLDFFFKLKSLMTNQINMIP